MIDQQHLNGLSRMAKFIESMNSTSSSSDKIQKLKDHSEDTFIVKAMKYTYNPYKKFRVHKGTAQKHPELNLDLYSDLFGLLDDLAGLKITGHSAISAVNGFASQLDPQQMEVFFMILDGDLKMRASTSLINRAIPNCIPTFSVALAHPYDPKHVDFENEFWLASRKLDGVRCICRKEGEDVLFYSRNGHEFTTLEKVADEIRKIPGDFVLDGEICMVDEDGVEDFQGIMKEIKRKDHTMENPMYLVFDMLTLEEFDLAGEGPSLSLVKRLSRISESISKNRLDPKIIKKVDQLPVDDDSFQKIVESAASLNWEGVMLRKNVPYSGKRTRDLLKVKKFYDDEYIVEEAHMGTIRWVEDGKEVEKDCLSYITIDHKGHKVRVGSGFSKEERERYYSDPSQIVGKTVTVKYFEESQNQDGGISLRFPTIKHIYENGRAT